MCWHAKQYQQLNLRKNIEKASCQSHCFPNQSLKHKTKHTQSPCHTNITNRYSNPPPQSFSFTAIIAFVVRGSGTKMKLLRNYFVSVLKITCVMMAIIFSWMRLIPLQSNYASKGQFLLCSCVVGQKIITYRFLAKSCETRV